MAERGEALMEWKNADPERRAEIRARKMARVEEAWNLHLRGTSYSKIAEELGISYAQARQDVKTRADMFWEEDLADSRKMRSVEVAKLDRIAMGLLGRIEKNDDDALEMYLKLSAMKARFLGLYAPVKVKMDHTVTHQRSESQQEDLDKRMLELYKRLKKRGKASPELEEWAKENVVDGEIVEKAKEVETKGTSVSEIADQDSKNSENDPPAS